MSLEVFVVVAQALLILLKRLWVPFLHVFNLAENEVELTPQDFDLLPESLNFCTIRSVFALEYLETYLSKLLGLVVLLD